MSLVKVYQYHNSKDFLRYLYTTLPTLDGTSWNSPPMDDCKHWVNDGVAFYGCEASDPDAVPVYQCYANVDPSVGQKSGQKYFFTLNPTQAGEGWYQSSNTPAFYAYATQDAGLVEFTMWYTDQPQYSFFVGNSSQTGAFAPPTGWLAVGWALGQGQGSQPFYALPGAAQLAYGFQALNFSNVTLPKGNPNVMDKQTINNSSRTASVTQTVSYTNSNTATVTLALTETIGESESLKADAGIPGLAGAEATTTMSLNLSSTQTVSEQVQQSITISGSVTVPPSGSVTVTGIMYIAPDISIPFALQCLVTAQLSNQNIGSPSNGQCTALTDLFRRDNPDFKGSVTPAPSLNGITVTMSGKMTGSYAVNADLEVADNPAGQSNTTAAANVGSKLRNVTKQITIVSNQQRVSAQGG